MEWHFDLRLLVWFVVENSLRAKINGKKEHRLEYEDDQSSGTNKTAADGYRNANKCLLTLKHGSCITLVFGVVV